MIGTETRPIYEDDDPGPMCVEALRSAWYAIRGIGEVGSIVMTEVLHDKFVDITHPQFREPGGETARFKGILVEYDLNLPVGTVEFRSRDGEVLGRLTHKTY